MQFSLFAATPPSSEHGRAVWRVQPSAERTAPNGVPAKSQDFVGRGGATERADFGGSAAEGAKAKFATTKFRQKSKQEQAQIDQMVQMVRTHMKNNT